MSFARAGLNKQKRSAPPEETSSSITTTSIIVKAEERAELDIMAFTYYVFMQTQTPPYKGSTSGWIYGTKAAGWKILRISVTFILFFKQVSFGYFNFNSISVKFLWLNLDLSPRKTI